MWILGKWFSKQTVRQIADTVIAEPEITRRSLARHVCEWLGWRNAKGELREASGKKALAELANQGIIKLPKPVKEFAFECKRIQSVEKDLKEQLPSIKPEVECELEDLGKLEVIPITSRCTKNSKRWNELMKEHHYLGAGPLCGTQIRYLIRSEIYGELGCLSFSAASKRLKSRDKWIGWSERARQANLEKVICNSRYLICPGIRVPNLASRVLGIAINRLPTDWKNQYGYEPVLVETFVDPNRFNGTCYKAANWIAIGETAGKKEGFQNGKKPTGKKQIFVLPLDKRCKTLLCEEPKETLVIRGQACDAKDWAEEEFGGVQVFERRLRTRLSSLARDFFKQPGTSIPLACEGSEAKTKAAYRFFGNKRFDMQTLLKGHIEATLERAQKHHTVLAVQDTTTVNYTAHPSTTGLGPINTKKDKGTGLILHCTLGFTLEGTPLGILNTQCWARDPKEAGKSDKRSELPIEEKESFKWLRSYQAVAEAQQLCPNTMFVSTGDRESDIHELFLEAQQTKNGPKLLIRADRARQRKARSVDENTETSENYEYLWDKLSKESLSGTLEIRIPRQANRPARDATLEIRFAKVVLKPPCKKPKLAPVEVWAVYAREVGFGPEVKEPVDWMLATTVPVTNFEEAIERVRWYALRWGIEVFHRVIKSGCRIEDRQLDDSESIKRCLAIDLVVAWRIFWLTKLGRETPDIPCDVVLAENEWKVLHVFAHHTPPPKTPPSLRDAIRMIAKMGGFLGRKCDGEPGTVTIWRGLMRLESMAEGYALALHERDGP